MYPSARVFHTSAMVAATWANARSSNRMEFHCIKVSQPFEFPKNLAPCCGQLPTGSWNAKRMGKQTDVGFNMSLRCFRKDSDGEDNVDLELAWPGSPREVSTSDVGVHAMPRLLCQSSRPHTLQPEATYQLGRIRRATARHAGTPRRPEIASAGNRTRVTSMATMYSTTRPLMPASSPAKNCY